MRTLKIKHKKIYENKPAFCYGGNVVSKFFKLFTNFKNRKTIKANKCQDVAYGKILENKNHKSFINLKQLRFKILTSILTLLVVLGLLIVLNSNSQIFANSNKNEIEQKINTSIIEQLGDLDFSNMQEVLDGLEDKYSLFGGESFKDKISQITNGTYFTSFDSVFAAVANLFFSGFIKILPLLLTIVAVTVLSSIVSNLKSNSAPGGVNDIIHFVCYSVVVLVLITSFTQIMQVTSSALKTMTTLMEVTFPLLLTLLTAVGAVASVSIYKPIVAILTGGVTLIFNSVLYPMFIISFVFVVISNLSSTMKLNKFNSFISSTFKWIMGFILTIFSSFLVIQGISAGKSDSVSIKATKFAVKSYVPLIGSFISDGMDFILLSSVLIKNAIGVGVLLMIFITILAPLVQIVVFKLGLQLLSAIIEPVGNSKITSFTSNCAKILAYPIAILVGVAFMFLLTVSLIMVTANIF